jgi:hypothetical protein
MRKEDPLMTDLRVVPEPPDPEEDGTGEPFHFKVVLEGTIVDWAYDEPGLRMIQVLSVNGKPHSGGSAGFAMHRNWLELSPIQLGEHVYDWRAERDAEDD